MITMAKLTDEEFEAAVQDALDSIPDEFLDELENVAFMLADEPDEEDYSRAGISAAGGELLGLYSGIAMTERGDDYGYADYPDTITIFKGPHERKGLSRVDTVEEIRRTVVHEIAHYFGMDEEQVDDMGYA